MLQHLRRYRRRHFYITNPFHHKCLSAREEPCIYMKVILIATRVFVLSHALSCSFLDSFSMSSRSYLQVRLIHERSSRAWQNLDDTQTSGRACLSRPTMPEQGHYVDRCPSRKSSNMQQPESANHNSLGRSLFPPLTSSMVFSAVRSL